MSTDFTKITPEEFGDAYANLTKKHGDAMARYAALSFLQNAMTLANAGFGKALVLAAEGDDPDRVQLMMASGENILNKALETWRDLDGRISDPQK